MRGMFTAGVMDVMMEAGIEFDGAIGVSAGAAFGVNYKSKQIGRVIRYNMQFCNDPRYCGLNSLITTGNIYNTEFAYKIVPLQYHPFDFAAYTKHPMEFVVVCTDIETGKPVYHTYAGWEDHGFDWIRASASMPLVSRKVMIDGKTYLDGGLSDSIPLGFMEEKGFAKNVVILTQPRAYRKERSSALSLSALLYGKNSALYRCLETRHERYNAQREEIFQREKEGKVFVIAPDEPLPVGRIEKDPKKLRLCHRIGYDTAKKQMDAVKAFLS